MYIHTNIYIYIFFFYGWIRTRESLVNGSSIHEIGPAQSGIFSLAQVGVKWNSLFCELGCPRLTVSKVSPSN